MKPSPPIFVFILLTLIPAKFTVAESVDRVRALYSAGFHEEAYKGILSMTGPLTQSSLWLLAEMYYLGHGTQVDLILAKRFIEQSSATPFPLSSVNRQKKRERKQLISLRARYHSNFQREMFSLGPVRCSKLHDHSEGFCGCGRSRINPLGLFHYLSKLSMR